MLLPNNLNFLVKVKSPHYTLMVVVSFHLVYYLSLPGRLFLSLFSLEFQGVVGEFSEW